MHSEAELLALTQVMSPVRRLTALKTGGEPGALVSALLGSGLQGLAGAGRFRLLISCCLQGNSSQQGKLQVGKLRDRAISVASHVGRQGLQSSIWGYRDF